MGTVVKTWLGFENYSPACIGWAVVAVAISVGRPPPSRLAYGTLFGGQDSVHVMGDGRPPLFAHGGSPFSRWSQQRVPCVGTTRMYGTTMHNVGVGAPPMRTGFANQGVLQWSPSARRACGVARPIACRLVQRNFFCVFLGYFELGNLKMSHV